MRNLKVIANDVATSFGTSSSLRSRPYIGILSCKLTLLWYHGSIIVLLDLVLLVGLVLVPRAYPVPLQSFKTS